VTRKKIAFHLFCLLVFSLIHPGTQAAPLPVVIDGSFGDWEPAVPVHTDPQGDNGSSSVDFKNLWIANDSDNLFLLFELGTHLKLNTDNDIILYLDLDNNTGTGINIQGIGADIKWRFGDRYGVFYSGTNKTVYWIDLLLRRGPTVSSDKFELAFSRTPDISLNVANTIRLVFRNETSGIQDTLPDAGAVSYSFSEDPVPSYTEIGLDKKRATDLRILSYNVLQDGLFSRTPSFSRILKAVKPDILSFQEIYSHTALETANLIEQILPSGDGESWYYAENADCITISRYPVLGTWSLDGNLAARITAPSSFNANCLLIINAHLPCCDDDSGRQEEIDRIMSFIRDAKTQGGSVTLPENTPLVITGDLNLVGWAQQLKSILEGDIVDEAQFGADFSPDWDSSPLTDGIPKHTSGREAYSWRSDTSSYTPGRLDFIIHSDSVLQSAKHFLVWTPGMDPGDLALYGLQQGDTPAASDHIPQIIDLRSRHKKQLWLLR